MYKGSSYNTIRGLYMTAKPYTVQQRYCQKAAGHLQEKECAHSDTHEYFEDSAIHDKMAVGSPAFWGPGLWKAIHAGSLNYPEQANRLTVEKMKGFIYGLPAIMACKACSTHALAFIQEHDSDLDTICASRQNLFRFFVDFHNYVNKRQNKPVLSYDDVLKMYNASL